MRFDDRAADRQSHAHAIGLGRVEGVEQAVEAVGLQSRATIPHGEAHAVRSVCLAAAQQLARFLAGAGIRLMTCPPRLPALTIRSRACRTSSRSGGSILSQRKAACALVTTA